MKKLILLLTAFSACSCFAQKASSNDIKQLFSDKLTDDIQWHIPGSSRTGACSYWIENNHLYACGVFSGKSIDMADIDFTNKSIRAHEIYYVKNTNDKLYVLSISPKSGKDTGEGYCYQEEATMIKRNTEPVELFMNSMEQADKAFQYLKSWKKGDSPQKIKTPKDSRSENEILADEALMNSMLDSILAVSETTTETTVAEKGTSPAAEELNDLFITDFSSLSETKAEKTADEKLRPAAEELWKNTYTIDFSSLSDSKTQTSTKASATGFDPELSELISGYKNGYISLKDNPLAKDGEYQSKANLAGSATKIYKTILGNYDMLADFGEYATKGEAETVYNEVVRKVETSQTPFTTVKLNEFVSASGKTTVWIPFDAPDAYKDFSIYVEMMESRKFDKNLNSSIVYFVVLRLE